MLTIGKRFDLKKSGVTSLEKEFLTCLNFFPAASEIYFFDGELTKIRLLPGLLQVRPVPKSKLLGTAVAELLQARCPSCHATRSVKALKDETQLNIIQINLAIINFLLLLLLRLLTTTTTNDHHHHHFQVLFNLPNFPIHCRLCWVSNTEPLGIAESSVYGSDAHPVAQLTASKVHVTFFGIN